MHSPVLAGRLACSVEGPLVVTEPGGAISDDTGGAAASE